MGRLLSQPAASRLRQAKVDRPVSAADLPILVRNTLGFANRVAQLHLSRAGIEYRRPAERRFDGPRSSLLAVRADKPLDNVLTQLRL
jgi:hypothetical protein